MAAVRSQNVIKDHTLKFPQDGQSAATGTKVEGLVFLCLVRWPQVRYAELEHPPNQGLRFEFSPSIGFSERCHWSSQGHLLGQRISNGIIWDGPSVCV